MFTIIKSFRRGARRENAAGCRRPARLQGAGEAVERKPREEMRRSTKKRTTTVKMAKITNENMKHIQI